MSEDKKVVPIKKAEEIDFNAPILDVNDKEVEGPDGTLRLGTVCATALMASMQDDKADGIQKLKRFNLARKIQGSVDDEDFPALALNSKQKTMIEDMVLKAYSTLIYARVYEALEGDTKSED